MTLQNFQSDFLWQRSSKKRSSSNTRMRCPIAARCDMLATLPFGPPGEVTCVLQRCISHLQVQCLICGFDCQLCNHDLSEHESFHGHIFSSKAWRSIIKEVPYTCQERFFIQGVLSGASYSEHDGTCCNICGSLQNAYAFSPPDILSCLLRCKLLILRSGRDIRI